MVISASHWPQPVQAEEGRATPASALAARDIAISLSWVTLPMTRRVASGFGTWRCLVDFLHKVSPTGIEANAGHAGLSHVLPIVTIGSISADNVHIGACS
ncbi:hypothetical protein HHA04nite_04920 [Halomonas halophila]|uniref:Uncharacterized protein n=1 Tax=Halomonas halophila TaxID=29573 RepID=A0ABQ0U075_9GAMM|nr:hypothetical protein HHA04nite_04920 [Halomonas halophila]